MKPPRGTTHLRLDTNGKRAVELIKDKDCASVLDDANKLLLNLMVTSYTGRAAR